MYYNPIITININMHVTSAPRRCSRGSAWCYHVALSATLHARGSRAKIDPLFPLFLIVLII